MGSFVYCTSKICLLSGIRRYIYWLQRLSVTFYVESFVIGNLHHVLSWLQQLFLHWWISSLFHIIMTQYSEGGYTKPLQVLALWSVSKDIVLYKDNRHLL